jgi:RNA polymerase sigma-70 factor (ECF subfamily)
LVARLCARDESAFVWLLDTHFAAMVRLARLYVADDATAEDVAQEAVLGVLRGIDRFEGRSSLKTWIFHILVNRAKSRGAREARTIPFSAYAQPAAESDDPVVAPERFLPPGHRWAAHWATPPEAWDTIPEEVLLAQETRAHVAAAIAGLPASQREIITLRDVEGWSAEEVCEALGVTDGNQRVLLHRARSKVRAALERYLDAEGTSSRPPASSSCA